METIHVREQFDDGFQSALQRLRAQIVYATRGRSRPTAFSVPADEYELLLTEINNLDGINRFPASDPAEPHEHVVLFGVKVFKAA